MSEDSRPIIAVDLDGTIHGYARGWHDGTLYDHAVPGFFAWLRRAAHHARVVVHTSRIAGPEDIAPIRAWMEHEHARCEGHDDMPAIEYAVTKPSAVASVDDRAVRFQGDWNAPDLQPERLLAARSWCQTEENPMTPRPNAAVARDDDHALDPGHVLDVICDEAGKKLAEKLFAHYVRDPNNTSRLPAFLIGLDRLMARVGGAPPERDPDDDHDDAAEDYDDDEDLHERPQDRRQARSRSELARDAEAAEVRDAVRLALEENP